MPWVSYAPNFEDVTLMRALGDVERGCYVDVGAGDPRADSVTRAFYERGWRGVNIDPLAHWHDRLAADRPGDVNLRLLAGETEGSARIFELDGTGCATADPLRARRYADEGRAVREVVVPARRLDAVLGQLDLGEIHFLRVGTDEGQAAVLRGIDLGRLRPWVVVVRSAPQSSSARADDADGCNDVLAAQGYEGVWFDGANVFYLATERRALAARLMLPPNAGDGFVRHAEQALRQEVSALRQRLSQGAAPGEDPADAAARARAVDDELLRRTYLPLPAMRPREGAPPRLFVDLQCVCADDAPEGVARAVAVLGALARARPGIEVVCGLVAGPAAARVRRALAAVVPDERLVVYALPLGLGDPGGRGIARLQSSAPRAPWARRVAELLREDVIAGAACDAVWVPGIAEPPAPGTVISAGPLAGGAPLVTSADLPDDDDDAQAIAEALGAVVERAARVVSAPPEARPRMAVVAPLPPIDSEVARFCAALLPGLARHYDIDVIGSQPGIDDARTAQCCRMRSIAWFEENARLYDRIVYHLAPERLHEHVLGLLQRHPGTVVLHALEFAPVFAHLERAQLDPGRLQRALYVSHGWPALREHAAYAGPAGGPVQGWPASKEIFDAADGVIVASERQARWARTMYGQGTPVRVGGSPDPTADGDPVADAHTRAIEFFHAAGRAARQRRLGAAIAAIGAPELAARATQAEIARCIVANQPAARRPQLLVDVTFLALQNLRTGIQRVVRSMLNFLLSRAIDGYRVEPVVLTPAGFVYARAATAAILGLDLGIRFPEREPVEPGAGDVFLGLDWNYHLGAHWPTAQFAEWRAWGVRFEFVVYDLLPLQLPYSVPGPDSENFRRWAVNVCSGADRLLCISRSVADEVLEAMPELAPGRAQPPAVEWFHLGADIQASLPTGGVTAVEEALLQRLATRRAFLMVGTVEPRKGHAVTLDAMERLWQKGVDVDLVIVGRPGWMVDALVERIRRHPEQGARLSWLERASDEALSRLYHTCSAVLMSSEGEGFGLPLIEAAMHGLPIVARDIPVFREIAGEHAYFWQAADAGPRTGLARPKRGPEVLAADAAALADALERWLVLHAEGRAPSPQGIEWTTWEAATLGLLRHVFGPQAALADARAAVARPVPEP